MTLATSTMRLASYEDLLVWQVLTNAGIPLRSDPRFGFNDLPWPSPDNDQITCHWCSDHRMREIHEGLYPSTSARSPRNSP
jgi:hypothetical protein